MKQQSIEELDCMGLVHSIMRNGMWSFREQFSNIFLTEASASALSLIIGAIHGMWQRDQDRAVHMANDFLRTIHYVTIHEMIAPHEQMQHWKIPNRVFHMAQDGYLSLGFSCYTYRTIAEIDELKSNSNAEELARLRIIDDSGNRCLIGALAFTKNYYLYSGNGGINLRRWDYSTKYPVAMIGAHDSSYRDWSSNT
jgi:hypothetical protein